MPTDAAAISEPCSARQARPRGESIRFCASQTVTMSSTPTTQYQSLSPCTTKSRSLSGGTAIPSGPPVTRSSVASTTAMMMPSPSVDEDIEPHAHDRVDTHQDRDLVGVVVRQEERRRRDQRGEREQVFPRRALPRGGQRGRSEGRPARRGE